MASLASLLLIMSLFVGTPAPAYATASFPIVESFGGSSAPGWVLGGTASLNNGWLTLTTNGTSQSGWAYYSQDFPSNLGIVVEFDYAAWGGSGADGTSFFLFDGSTTNFTPGPSGGSLGYAAKVSGPQKNGISNAYVGIGLDEYGSFSNPGAGLIDGPGFAPQRVVIRGPGNGLSGYNFLTNASAPTMLGNRTTGRHVQMTISTDNKITVRIQPGPGQPYQTYISNYTLPSAPPTTLKLGFAASTGGATNYHEIRNLTVSVPVELPLTMTSSAGTASVAPGQQITYTVTTTNTGLNDAIGSAINLSASGLTDISWTCADAAGAACASPSGTGSSAGVDLPVGGQVTLTVTATVAANATGSVLMTADVVPPTGYTNTSTSSSATLTNGVIVLPVASNQSVTVEAGTSTAITLQATDPTGLPLTYSVVSQPAHGTLTGAAPNVTYTPDPGYIGSDSFTFKANNGAGDSAPATVAITVNDTIAPTISGATDRAPDANGWYNHDVTVTFTCADTGSGVASCTAPATLSSDGANQSVTGTAVDNAGNSASAAVIGINVDETAPVVTYAGNAGTYTVDQMVSITCTATDDLSGLATDTCANISGPAYSFVLGANSYAASAVDNAGNTGTSSTSFMVNVSNGSLCALTKQFETKDGVANSLCVKLDAAAKQAAAGNTGASNNILQAYINEVAAQSDKSMTGAQADILTQMAEALMQ